MTQISRVFRTVLNQVIVLLVLTGVARAEVSPIDDARLDEIAERARRAFGIPGLTITIVEPERTRVRAYGTRQLGGRAKIDKDTIFAIYSNSKAFTALALAMLVDEGKVSWEDPVSDYLPEFQMYDPYVTREFRVRDLMIHSSGLGYNAGGLMVGPGTTFTAPEVVANLRHLKPVSSFRTEFAYSNLMYIIAGELIASVSGQPWERFVDDKIMRPLALGNCAADLTRLRGRKNIAEAHAISQGNLQMLKRSGPLNMDVSGPAGGIYCSSASMAKWLQALIAMSDKETAQSLISPGGFAQLISPYTLMPVSPGAAANGKTHFSAYGMGWNLSDYKGFKQVTHTGADAGMVSQVLFFPELERGFVIMLNTGSGEALQAVRNSILQVMFPPEQGAEKDFIAFYAAQAGQMQGMLDGAMARFGKAGAQEDLSLPLAAYVGIYRDPWFGDVTVSQEPEGLYFRSADLQICAAKCCRSPVTASW